MLLSKTWELYESDKRIEGFSPQTLKAYKLQSKLLIQYFNDVNIKSLTTERLKEYLAKSVNTSSRQVWLIEFDLLNRYFVDHTRKGIYRKIQQ